MPGPPRKPTHLKLIAGNPGKWKLKKNEPKPTAGIPPVPDHLSDEARAEWARIATELNAIGLLTHVDRAALAAYCQTWADWVEAEEQLRRYGKVVKSPVKTVTRLSGGTEVTETSGGFPMQLPFLPIRNRASKIMHKFLTEFGMTPAARSRISITHASDQEDPALAYFA